MKSHNITLIPPVSRELRDLILYRFPPRSHSSASITAATSIRSAPAAGSPWPGNTRAIVTAAARPWIGRTTTNLP